MINNKIKIFETFAGIGAQTKALNNIIKNKESLYYIGKNDIIIENIGISEWYIDAIIAYAKIHHLEEYKKEYINTFIIKNKEEFSKNIKNFTYKNETWKKLIIKLYSTSKNYKDKYKFSSDSKKESNLKYVKEDKLKELYIANKVAKNYGSIMEIKGNELPKDIDIFTYSFPCQAISLQGARGGLEKNSETSSSLVWQILRILGEMKDNNNLPKILLMENVKALFGKKFIDTWNEIKLILEDYGYQTFDTVINSLDKGSIQRRERAFAISIRNDINFNKEEIFTKDKDILINDKTIEDILITKKQTPIELKEDIIIPLNTNKYIDNIRNKQIEDDLISDEKCIMNDLYKYIENEKFTMKSSGIKSLNLKNYSTFISEAILHSIDGKSPTITASGAKSRIKIIDNNHNYRILTSLELWLLMGFEKEDYFKVNKFINDENLLNINIENSMKIKEPLEIKKLSKGTLNRLAGNSIQVQVLESLFFDILKFL